MIANNAERQLIARDRQLNGLAAVLDPDLLNECLSRLTDKRVLVRDRKYIRYKPHTNCLVSYEHGCTSSISPMYAKAYAGEFEQKFTKDDLRVSQGWAPKEKLWAIPEHRVLVRQFPMDGRLRSLKVLADTEAFERLVQRMLPGNPDASDARVRTLAYKPERRYVAKLSGNEIGEVVLKFYGFRAFNRSLTNLRYLQWIGFELMPRLLGHSRRRQALALAWRRGLIFRQLLGDVSHRERIAASVGSALAKLHSQPTTDSLRTWSPHIERARVFELTETLAYLLPSHALHTRRVSDLICKRITQASVNKHLIHGDFHSKQILVGDHGVRFLDADELAVGPAQLDIGTFIAHLYRDAICGRTSPSVARTVAAAFLDGYWRAGGGTESVSAFTALALLKFSHHPFRASECNWDKGVGRVIDLAEEFASHPANTSKESGAI